MGQSLLVLALPSEIGLRLDSLPSTQTTASPTAGIANIVHVSRTQRSLQSPNQRLSPAAIRWLPVRQA
jgi:hypothetical protein